MNATTATVAIRSQRGRWPIAIITLAILVLANYAHGLVSRLAVFRGLYAAHEFYVPESIDKIAGVTLCVLTVWLQRDQGPRGVSRELGLSAPLLPVIRICADRFVTEVARLCAHAELHTTYQARSAVVSHHLFAVVRFLQRGTEWPFWLVVWPSALLFGWGHVEQGQTFREMAELFFLTCAGGVTFAWLVYRWQNLWMAVALHICMNLWWELFSVARSAIGGWLPFALQNLTMVLAIIVTPTLDAPQEKTIRAASSR